MRQPSEVLCQIVARRVIRSSWRSVYVFVWGYLYTGLMSLGQVYLERLRFGSRIEAPEARPAATGAPGF